MTKVRQSIGNDATAENVLEKVNREVLPVLRALLREHNLKNIEPITISEDTTLTPEHYVVLVDASANSVTITLPSLTDEEGASDDDVLGLLYCIKSIDSTNTVTVVGTVDGASDPTLATKEGFIICAQTDGWYKLADV